MPFLERPRFGPTSVFCSDLAKRLGCYVAAGYPELLEGEDLQQCIQNDCVMINNSDFPEEDLPSSDRKKERRIVGANSVMLCGPLGERVGAYRKTNLFRTDKTWAAAGLHVVLLRSDLVLNKHSFQGLVSLRSTFHLH